MNKSQLRQFILQSHQAGYAAGDDAYNTEESDGSTTITFQSGNWQHHDNFFGGEPYGGREVVFFNNKPAWIMVYYGTVVPSITDIKPIYKFLQSALKLAPEPAPYRGPQEFTQGDFHYSNSWQGDLENFSGIEKIFLNDKQIYQAQYLGGLVDQRK
jgi:hypothetical protein